MSRDCLACLQGIAQLKLMGDTHISLFASFSLTHVCISADKPENMQPSYEARTERIGVYNSFMLQ